MAIVVYLMIGILFVYLIYDIFFTNCHIEQIPDVCKENIRYFVKYKVNKEWLDWKNEQGLLHIFNTKDKAKKAIKNF